MADSVELETTPQASQPDTKPDVQGGRDVEPEAEKQVKLLVNERQKAQQRLLEKAASAKNTPSKLDVVAENPEAHKVAAVIEKNKPPQDRDVRLVLRAIVENPEELNNVGKLSEWIMELDVASAKIGKTEDAQHEIDTYKRKLVKQLAQTVVEKTKQQNPSSKHDDIRREKTIEYWSKHVGAKVTPGTFVTLVEKMAPPVEGDEEVRHTWKLFDDIDTLPEPEDRQFVKDVNNEIADSPTAITQHYLEGLLTELRHHPNIPDNIKKTMRGNIDREIVRIQDEQRIAAQEAQRKREAKQFTDNPVRQNEVTNALVENDQLAERVNSCGREINASFEANAETARTEGRNESLRSLVIRARYPQAGSERAKTVEDIAAFQEELRRLRAGVPFSNSRDEQLAQALEGYLAAQKDFIGQSKQVLDLTGGSLSRELSSYFRDSEDREFIQTTLSSPEAVIKAYLNNNGNVEVFKREVVRIFNSVFRNADQNTDQPFEQVFSPLRHQPVVEEISNLVAEIEDEARKRRIVVEGAADLASQLRELRSKLSTERLLRSYTHNVAFILQTRGTLETLAGFAERFVAADLDYAFKDDPVVLMAAHLLEQKTNQELANNNWSIPQTFMQPIAEQGGIQVDNEVMEMLRKYFKDEKQDWEIQRAYRIAKGISLGVTAVILDRLGEADPPPQGSFAANRGYFGESIMPTWNPMRHYFYRWGLPNEMRKVMYSFVRKHGSLEGWNHNQLDEVEKEMKSMTGPQLVDYLNRMGGKPLHEMHNLYGVGGPLTRGGWRMDAATMHMLEVEGGRALELSFDIGKWNKEGKKFEDVKYEPPGAALKKFDGVNWEKSWKNFRRAGTGVMYYWADARAKEMVKKQMHKDGVHIADHHAEEEYINEKAKPIKQEYYEEIYQHIRKINPLKFAYFEKEDMYDSGKFKDSIRGQAIVSVFGEKIESVLGKDRVTIAPVLGDVKRVEGNLLLVQERALGRVQEEFDAGNKDAQWGIEEADFDLIQNPEEKSEAIKYWRALNNAIDTKIYSITPGPGKAPEKLTAVQYFSRLEHKFFIGSEDLDFSQLQFKNAGQSLVGRVFKDAFGLSGGIGKLMGFDGVLKAAAASRDYHKIIEAIHEIAHPLVGVHGPGKESEVVYDLAVMTARFFQKNWQARLPGGVGSLVGSLNIGGKSSVSKDMLGWRTWEWDEDVTRAYIEDLFLGNMLTHHDFEKLKKELGARDIQYVADLMRSGVPALIMLVLITALQQALKED